MSKKAFPGSKGICSLEAFSVGSSAYLRYGKIMIEKLLDSSNFKKLTMINNFNYLSLFSDIFNENSYSRFLAYLFDSQANHGLNQQFFRYWLKNVSKIKLPLQSDSIIKASFNWRTHENRYIDIIIQIISKDTGHATHIIGIENKKFTKDSENQLSDYQRDIVSTFHKCENILIYLTPKGEKGKSASDNISKCPCVAVSYSTLIHACENNFKTENADILKLITHLKKFIEFNIISGENMNDSKKNIVDAISRKSEYKNAISEIIKYYPTYKTIRNLVYEDITPQLSKIYDHASLAWIYPHSSNTPHEINFAINDLNELIGNRKIGFYYMLYSSTPNPHTGDTICVRLMAYCGDNYEYVKRSQDLAKKIKKADIFPENITPAKKWKPWECLYSGQMYHLQDMADLDVDSIVDIMQDCIEKTYEPLKKFLKSNM